MTMAFAYPGMQFNPFMAEGIYIFTYPIDHEHLHSKPYGNEPLNTKPYSTQSHPPSHTQERCV